MPLNLIVAKHLGFIIKFICYTKVWGFVIGGATGVTLCSGAIPWMTVVLSVDWMFYKISIFAIFISRHIVNVMFDVSLYTSNAWTHDVKIIVF